MPFVDLCVPAGARVSLEELRRCSDQLIGSQLGSLALVLTVWCWRRRLRGRGGGRRERRPEAQGGSHYTYSTNSKLEGGGDAALPAQANSVQLLGETAQSKAGRPKKAKLYTPSAANGLQLANGKEETTPKQLRRLTLKLEDAASAQSMVGMGGLGTEKEAKEELTVVE